MFLDLLILDNYLQDITMKNGTIEVQVLLLISCFANDMDVSTKWHFLGLATFKFMNVNSWKFQKQLCWLEILVLKEVAKIGTYCLKVTRTQT